MTDRVKHMAGRREGDRSAVKIQALPASKGSTVPLGRSPAMPALTAKPPKTRPAHSREQSHCLVMSERGLKGEGEDNRRREGQERTGLC